MKKILVHHKRNETSVAVITNGEVTYYCIERNDNQHLVGNIYKGKIQNFLPGMQAAFVDIGRDKNAFLQLNKKRTFEIGQDIVIQIKKDAIGTKGPRATLELSIPAHNFIFMPKTKYIGVSRKIENEKRKKLAEMAKNFCPKNAGLIVRTAAAECDRKTFKSDINNLNKFWKSIEKNLAKKKAPKLLYSDNSLISRIIRDELKNDVTVFMIDSLKLTNQAIKIAKGIVPNLADRIKRYVEIDNVNIFEKFNVAEEIKKLSERELKLPSGGFIVIDKTEALTAIDVNTGKFVGDANLSDTVYKTNIEAATMIMKQLRLRDIGGIIIVDFIDMHIDEQKESLLAYLREKAKTDYSKTKVIDMTPLGLVEITRKRSRDV